MYNMMQKIYINEEKSEKVGDDNKFKNRGKMIKNNENIRKQKIRESQITCNQKLVALHYESDTFMYIIWQ